MSAKQPKAFISYSWSSSQHCDLIRSYAERLRNDGVDVVLDQWDLSEGHDKYAFMEKMVLDPHVTHVLIFSDRRYMEKANERKAGVGTESQIISQEIYDQVQQEKFIPIFCEIQENDEPYLPVFLKSRIGIDFSTSEKVNVNWERLLRVLYGKPLYEKPTLGKAPSFLLDGGRPSLPTIGKHNSLREALLNNKPTVAIYRKDFIESVISYADSLRIREDPKVKNPDEKVLSDLHNLLPLREQLIDWFYLELSILEAKSFDDMIFKFLERILILKYPPSGVSYWQDWWADTPCLFLYELFLYLIAILIKEDKFESLRNIFSAQFLLPDIQMSRGRDFVPYSEFWGHSIALGRKNERLNPKRIDINGDFIKERATRSDIPFTEVMQAELLILVIGFISGGYAWYPHTLPYSESVRFPFFTRLARHKYFEQFEVITGISSVDELRQKVLEGCNKFGSWEMSFHMPFFSLPNLLNIGKWDTI